MWVSASNLPTQLLLIKSCTMRLRWFSSGLQLHVQLLNLCQSTLVFFLSVYISAQPCQSRFHTMTPVCPSVAALCDRHYCLRSRRINADTSLLIKGHGANQSSRNLLLHLGDFDLTFIWTVTFSSTLRAADAQICYTAPIESLF